MNESNIDTEAGAYIIPKKINPAPLFPNLKKKTVYLEKYPCFVYQNHCFACQNTYFALILNSSSAPQQHVAVGQEEVL